MSSTPASTPNFHLIIDALDDYTKQTGIDLTKNPFAETLWNCDSPDSILQLLQDKAHAFKDYREGNHKLIKWLSPVVKVLHTFSGILSVAAGLVSPTDRFILSHWILTPRPGAIPTYKINRRWYRFSLHGTVSSLISLVELL
jgi:hypothetical protein